MRFEVTYSTRNGELAEYHDEPPLENAVCEDTTHTETLDLRGLIDKSFGLRDTEWWFDNGANHRVEDGKFKRELTTSKWFIEVPDMETAIAYAKLHTVVIRRHEHDFLTPIIRLTLHDADTE